METIKESLTFDDVLLIPKYSDVLPSETNISLNLTKKITLKVPFLSSAMDTVTEARMAIAVAKAGGLGVIHRNMSIIDQISEIKKVKLKKLIVGAAVGVGDNELQRAKAILKNKVDLIVVDTAHGHTEKVADIIKKIIKIKPKNISKKKLLLGFVEKKLPKPAIETETARILKKNRKNSNIIIYIIINPILI